MDKTKQPYRYKAGDKVVLVYLRHRPQGVVTIDQPRSSLTVHVRDQDGTNRTPNASNIMLHEDWVKQEETRQAEELALAGDSRKAMLDTFRAALTEYLPTHPIPAKGKQKKAAIQVAYDHALAASDARRYYDLGRGFAGRRLRASKDSRPQPVPTDDEQTGLSLIMIGGQAFRASYRKAARAAGVVPVVADADWDVEPAKVEPKLEIHVELPSEASTTRQPVELPPSRGEVVLQKFVAALDTITLGFILNDLRAEADPGVNLIRRYVAEELGRKRGM